MDDGPSRAWTPESGGAGGEEMAWGAGRGGGAQRHVDEDDEGYGGEEEEGGVGEGGEGLEASRSSPASDWMRGELCKRAVRLLVLVVVLAGWVCLHAQLVTTTKNDKPDTE